MFSNPQQQLLANLRQKFMCDVSIFISKSIQNQLRVPSHSSPLPGSLSSNWWNLYLLGNLPLKGVSSFESILSQVPERRSLDIRFTSFCRKFSLSPILLNWMAHSTSGSAGTRVGLGWALLRALLPGISADGRRRTRATQGCNPSTSGLQDEGRERGERAGDDGQHRAGETEPRACDDEILKGE